MLPGPHDLWAAMRGAAAHCRLVTIFHCPSQRALIPCERKQCEKEAMFELSKKFLRQTKDRFSLLEGDKSGSTSRNAGTMIRSWHVSRELRLVCFCSIIKSAIKRPHGNLFFPSFFFALYSVTLDRLNPTDIVFRGIAVCIL